ncbi:unnamed protein product [Bursaphelenchus xylophilus]|nr:unnamed protein product [Bursaphelenchus xylophilus]CAG9094827.1 unnamed protein product [Bursaphelenchus xylophilus]
MMSQQTTVHVQPKPRFIPAVVCIAVQGLIVFGLFSCAYYLIIPQLSPKINGFICDDPSLKYTYHDNTIDIAVVHCFSFLIVLIAFLVECEPHRCLRTRKLTTDDSEVALNHRIFRLLHTVLALAFGAVGNYLLYQVVKFSFGRLRPHFFDVCRPDVSACRPGDYVETYKCSGTNMKAVRDAHLSFYSGHASTAFFYATFATAYLHMRVIRRTVNCLPWLFMFGCAWFAGAMFVAGSRVQDNKHHFVDVVVGSVVGIALGLGLVLGYVRQAAHRYAQPSTTYVVTADDTP